MNTTRKQIASGPTAPVPKDPQPTVDRIDELARRVLSGDILLPKFQREFVWNRSQILELLDSVNNNYPIGSVLLWQSRQELRSENCIADLEINLPKPDYPVNYLLDGQQRLSSICGSLFWSGSDPKSQWNIAYNLRTRKFQHLDTLDSPPLHLMPTRLLNDSADYFKRVSDIDSSSIADKTDLQTAAKLLFSRIKDYKIAVVTLGDMSLNDVAPIFERINSTGTPLTIVDLMRAATWSTEFDLLDTIDAILDELSDKGFGGIDRKVVLRSLSSAAGGGYSSSSIDSLRNYEATRLIEVAQQVADSFRRTIDFLVQQLKLPTDSAVPYANQLVILADLFRGLPHPSASQYTEIKRWFWSTSAGEYFSGWNTGQMSADKQSVDDFVAGRSIGISFPVVMPSASIWLSRAFRRNTAYAKLFAILLADAEPRDLLTGNRIDVSPSLWWANNREFHHFFPQAYLRTRGTPVQQINVLANIIALSSVSNRQISHAAPSQYLARIRDAAGSQLDAWLESNLISQDAYSAAMADDYDGFLISRAKTLHDKLSKYIY